MPKTIANFVDYIGGHIKGSQHVPSQSLDSKLPGLIQQLRGKKIVIFHCLLSQQRGPGAAVRYMRQRDSIFPATTNAETQPDKEGHPAADDGKAADKATQQIVYCLQGGFMEWQKEFADDERLTEGYRKDLWENI